MKTKIVQIVLALMIAFQLNAEKTEVEKFQIPIDQKERIVLENPIGKADILNPELISKLTNCKVVRVTYVYSAFAPIGYDQENLNTNRIQNLKSLINLNSKKIKWDEVAQTGCANSSCAKTMLHGFVIDFVPNNAFHYGRIDKQNFNCSAQESKTIKGENGTLLTIPANSFEYEDGTAVRGDVQIELREGLDFENIVKGNLLTVTDKGELLQTGGMIEVQAYSNGKNINLKNGKTIDVTIPEKNKKEGMQFYKGEFEGDKIVWKDPVELNVVKEQVQDEMAIANWAIIGVFNNNISWKSTRTEGKGFKGFTREEVKWNSEVAANEKGNKITEAKYAQDDELGRLELTINKKKVRFNNGDYLPYKGVMKGLDKKQAKAVERWFNSGARLNKDSVCLVLNPKNGSFTQQFNENFNGKNNTKGVNNGRLNEDLNYTFSMRNLGWANIDRLARFTNTYRGNLEVDLKNISDTSFASVALVIPSADIFIPGYKMEKGNYAFTHGDREQNVPLPKNETAYIVSTYNQGGKDYFGTKKITIGSRDVETLTMLKKEKAIALKEIERLF